MDSKLTLAIVLWVSGFFAGVIAAARWWRMDATQSATSTPEPVAVDLPTASGRPVQRAGQRLAAPIVAGARADLLSLRNVARNVSRSVSSIGARSTASPTSA
jgi:hypothetical protein